MVVHREHLKCDVCGTIIALRTQIGWLKQYPIRIYCGKCGILIEGSVSIDHEGSNFSQDFLNASTISNPMPTPDFVMEASGELLADKMQACKNGKLPKNFSPFLKTMNLMDLEMMADFAKSTARFLYFRKEKWPEIRRINELWINEKYEYLEKEMRKYLHPKTFPLSNELEYLRGLNTLNLIGLSIIFDKGRFQQNDQFIMQEIVELADINFSQFCNLINYFNENRIIQACELRIFRQFDNFINLFPNLVPVFGMQFYKEIPKDISINKGLSTVSFEDLKQFYIDTYETVADAIDLIVSYNNLKYRGNYEIMAAKRKKILSLTDFSKMSKGDKIKFLDGKEKFDELIFPNLDNRIRNAIGHNSYECDGISQIITLYLKGPSDKSNVVRIYLLDFAKACWELFLCLIDLYGLVYQTRKNYYVINGYGSIGPEVIEEYGLFNEVQYK